MQTISPGAEGRKRAFECRSQAAGADQPGDGILHHAAFAASHGAVEPHASSDDRRRPPLGEAGQRQTLVLSALGCLADRCRSR